MRVYRVSLVVSGYVPFDIEANNEEEAIEKARAETGKDDFNIGSELEITDTFFQNEYSGEVKL